MGSNATGSRVTCWDRVVPVLGKLLADHLEQLPAAKQNDIALDVVRHPGVRLETI